MQCETFRLAAKPRSKDYDLEGGWLEHGNSSPLHAWVVAPFPSFLLERALVMEVGARSEAGPVEGSSVLEARPAEPRSEPASVR